MIKNLRFKPQVDTLLKFIRSHYEKLALGILIIVGCNACRQSFSIWFHSLRLPLELETREATVWLHVLAMKAGINIYDHAKVAFVNMGHGPIDPIVKYFVSKIFPFLRGNWVARFFVLLLPLGFGLTCSNALKNTSLLAKLVILLFFSSAIFGSISTFQFFYPLVGRSDATALFFCLLTMFYIQKVKATKYYFWAGYGVLCGIVFLTNFRYFPFILSLAFFPLFFERLNTGKIQLLKNLSIFSFSILLPFFLILFFYFNLNFSRYFEHFFGIFGIGEKLPSVGPSYELLPAHMVPRFIWLILIAVINYGAWSYRRSFFLIDRFQHLLGAGFLIFANLFACSVAFYYNRTAGGLYYYCPAFLIVWMFVLMYSPQSIWARISIAILASKITFYAFPISENINQAKVFQQLYAAQTNFSNELRYLNEKYGLYSEELYFFKDEYQNEKVDMGDLILLTPHDEEFNTTAHQHFESLKKKPPMYVYASFTVSPVLSDLLHRQYRQLMESPPHLAANNFRTTRVFKLKSSGKK